MSGWIDQVAWLRLDLLGGLLLAAILGGAIGFEREYSGKPAGLRTNILICIGSALLTDLSLTFADFEFNELIRADPSRVAAQIVTGVGFLGAGTIIQARGSVSGLTTAATLWVVAAIGMSVGTGSYIEAVGTTMLVLFTLVMLAKLEDALLEKRSRRMFELVLVGDSGIVNRMIELMEKEGLKVTCDSAKMDADRKGWVAVFEARGPEARFRHMRQALLERPEVKGFSLS